MLRPDAKREYDQDNNMFATRTQFYAIEVARNRLGVNDDSESPSSLVQGRGVNSLGGSS